MARRQNKSRTPKSAPPVRDTKRIYTPHDVMDELGMDGYKGKSANTILARLGKYAGLVEGSDFVKIHRTAIVYTPHGLKLLRAEWDARESRRHKAR